MVPWVECPTMEVDWDRPASEIFASVPTEAFAQAKRLLAAVAGEIPARARKLAMAVRLRTAGRFHREAVSLARQVGGDWRDVILANISYDLAIAMCGCSTVALPTAEGPVVARNMDWWPEDLLAQASYLVRNVRGGRLLFANAGWPGAIGVVTGLSQNGFAVVLNAVISTRGASRTGYPVLLHLRRVVEDARSFEKALDWLSNQHLTTSGLFTLVGADNAQRVVIERTPRECAQRWAEAGKPLFATNDYRKMFQPEERAVGEIYETTCHRFDALCRMFAGHRADRRVSDEELLYALSDPHIIQGITAQHIIMRPRERVVRMFAPRRLVEPEPN